MFRKTFIVDKYTINSFDGVDSLDKKIIMNDINAALFHFDDFINENKSILDSMIVIINLSSESQGRLLELMLQQYFDVYCLRIATVVLKQKDKETSINLFDRNNKPSIRFELEESFKLETETEPIAEESVVETKKQPKKKRKNRNNEPYYAQAHIGYNYFNLQHSSVSGPDNW